MCNSAPLSEPAKRAAAKLRAERPTFEAQAWNQRVAVKAESFGLAGDALQEFCDIAEGLK